VWYIFCKEYNKKFSKNQVGEIFQAIYMKPTQAMKTNDEIPKTDKIITEEVGGEVGSEISYEYEIIPNIPDLVNLIDCVKNYYNSTGIDPEEREEWKVKAGIQKETGNIPTSVHKIVERCFKVQLKKFL
jgi:hypothetical protein